MQRYHRTLLVVSAVLGLLAALVSAISMLGSARVVEVVSLFAGAFGAGAALVSALYERRTWPSRSA